jgi:hypothetical protein
MALKVALVACGTAVLGASLGPLDVTRPHSGTSAWSDPRLNMFVADQWSHAGAPLTALLVHVPKTAGETVVTALCACRGVNVTVVHAPRYSQSRPSAAALAAFDRVVVTARDPVARFASAFNCDSYIFVRC